MKVELRPLAPPTYRYHQLHAPDADWQETNCATDMWIEVLHAWGLDPVAGLAFTPGTDFDGEQWTMFTYPEEDLRSLYGIEVHELNAWRPLVDHLEDHLRLGHLVAFDVDAYYLPDTAVAYRLHHQKTTIGAQMVDREAKVLGYFHNAGYAELGGDDFDAVFHLGAHAEPLAVAMPPFALAIRFDEVHTHPTDLVADVQARLRLHLDRRPHENPVARLAKRMDEDLSRIAAEGMDAFHRYAFGSCRHLGANGQLAAAFVEWLRLHDRAADRGALDTAAECYRLVSTGAKAAEFTLARAAAGRPVDLPGVMAPLAVAWDEAASLLADSYGS